MKDMKLYSTQDMESLKEKINVYKTAYTKLKEGITVEEILKKQDQLNSLKMQLSQLAELTSSVEEKQETKIEEHEEQVQKISMQIHLLNQTFEEMNRELSSFIQKENPMTTEKKTDSYKDHSHPINTTTTANPEENLPTINEGFGSPNVAPSYKQLQKFAGPALIPFKENFPDMPVPSDAKQILPHEGRHFNQHYFQSISTHPSEIYNGLYKNIAKTASFHFKNETSVQEIPIQPYANPESKSKVVINESANNVPIQTKVEETSLPATQEIALAETAQPNVLAEEEILHLSLIHI